MIEKLLVANRGEIAARVFRTARALGIGTVAVFSDPDADAPFVAAADEAVRLPGAAPADTYLRTDLVLAAAAGTGADAVHPGYGFLAENADFARSVTRAGLTFVGPPAEAIAAMGDKVRAKALMAAAGVPVLPGATVPEEGSATELAEAGARVGFPLLVKAAFGGGGRGMRVVSSEPGLAAAVSAARREAVAAFGDGTVFLERLVGDPRHVEVQVFGDTHGNVVHLFERECSVQRRYQKIIEEAPSPAVDDRLRAELGAAAVAAAEAIGYVGAGTVEFVLAGGEFWFLEANTRLQVEHPVTELVTGLDLVELQLRVADGEPLPAAALNATLTGHAIEARLYAEDVPAGFLPATGTLHTFAVPDGPGLRVDAGVADGSVVGPHYDPMLAKVVGSGPTRASAARALARALADARIHGVITNRDLLVAVLREPEFLAGGTDTGYLGRHPELLTSPPSADTVRTAAVAAALAAQAGHRRDARVLASLPSGWRNLGTVRQRARFEVAGQPVLVEYRVERDGVALWVDGESLDGTRVVRAAPEEVVLELAGVRRRMRVARHGEVAWVDGPLGSVALTVLPRLPDPVAATRAGSLLAPMPGAVRRVLAEPSAPVSRGQPLVVLEAMKMEHIIEAPRPGVLTELRVAPGDQVDTGQLLAVVTEPEPTADTDPEPTADTEPEPTADTDQEPTAGTEREPTAGTERELTVGTEP